MGRAGGGSRGGGFGGGRRGGSFGGGGSRGGSFGGASRGSIRGSSRSSGHSSRPLVRPTIWVGPRIDRRSDGGGSGGTGPGQQNQRNNGPQGQGGLLVILKLVMALCAIILLPLMVMGIIENAGAAERTPLAAGAVEETGYYTDELGWIDDQAALLTGLKHFYQVTGVQPYVYITERIGSGDFASDQEITDFAEAQYNQLFRDEAHLLLVFYEKDGTYRTYCLAGIQATNAVMDAEARGVLLEKIDKYYYSSGLSDAEFFAKSFAEAGNEIMDNKRFPTAQLVMADMFVFGAAFLGTIVLKRREKEQKELERMLNTPLETFGDQEAEELAKKYE